MIFLFDAQDGRIRDCNQSAIAVTGYSHEVLTTMSVMDIFPQQLLFADFPFQPHATPDKTAIATPSITPCRNRSGRETTVELSVQMAQLKTATLGLIVARDISARIRAEEDLKRSELRYRALFEDSPTSLWEEDFSRLKRHFDQLKKDGIQSTCRLYRRGQK